MTEYHCDIGGAPQTVIKTDRGMQEVAKNAKPGDVFAVQGEYEKDVLWSASGHEGKPITILLDRMALMARIDFEISGDWIRLLGGDWNNSQIRITGDHNRVARTLFRDGKPGGNKDKFHSAICIMGTASYNRVDHNEVRNWIGKGIRHAYFSSMPEGNLIDHNWLIDGNDGSDKNGREWIQVGQGSSSLSYSPGTIVEYNLIEDYSLESEAISLKSHGNIVRYNTLIDCKKASITIRSSMNCQVIGNTLIDCGGINVYGTGHMVNGNDVQGRKSRIWIRSGDCTAEQLIRVDGVPSEFEGGHPAAIHVDVLDNVISGPGSLLSLGKKGRGKREYYDIQHIPATDIRIRHDDDVKKEGKTKYVTFVDDDYGDDDYGHHVSPVRVMHADVGRNAPDPHCQRPPDPPIIPPIITPGISVNMFIKDISSPIVIESPELSLIVEKIDGD